MQNNSLEFYSIEDIEKEIPRLKLRIETKKNAPDYKFYRCKLKDLQVILKSPLDFIKEIKANEYFKTLKVLLAQNETLTYDHKFIFSETGNKIELFIQHSQEFDDKSYWNNLAEAYVMQDYKKVSITKLKSLFSANRKFRNNLMNKQEFDLLKKMPSPITIFRGGSPREENTKRYGISWSLDREIAKMFASKKELQTKKEMIVIKKRIPKTKVIAYFKERNEEEIIYLGE